jgi:ATP-binding cassette subfamily B protein
MNPHSDYRDRRIRHRDLKRRESLKPGNQLRQLQNVPRALGLAWAAAPVPATGFVTLMIVRGVLPVFMVYLTRSLVNSVVMLIGHPADQSLWRQALAAAALMGLVMAAVEVLACITGYLETVLAERTQDHMHCLIQTKAVSLDLQFFESPEYYDLLQRAGVEAIDRPQNLLRTMGDLLQSAITLTAMSGVLIGFVWWMPLALLIATFPAFHLALKATWQLNRWRLNHTEDQRHLGYYKNLLLNDHAATEVRLFHLGPYIMGAYRSLRQTIRDERLRIAQKHMLLQIGAVILGLAVSGGSMIWVAWQAVHGRFNLGDIAMFWQAMNQGQRLMRGLLSSVGDLYRNLLFLEDIFTFLGLEPVLREPADPAVSPDGLHAGIRLEEIGFCYPYSKRMALSDFTLEIPAGQIVAIVGENGAGKSTLIKLLCRFYDPDDGRITWDGVDIRQIRQQELQRRITVLFQQFQSYHATASENIALGDIDKRSDNAGVMQAAASAGADRIINRLPDGYETLLGKWFGHAELSTGEWQRLALARAFFRQADLVILDEPTSAMDSWAEAAWMNRFRDLVADRTALIITHRFTTAMQADIIHVMDQGRIVESGTHDELVNLGGRYAISWKQQMREGCTSHSHSLSSAALPRPCRPT